MRRFVKRTLAVIFVVLVAGYFTCGVWLAWLGQALIAAEPPTKAEAIICLAGDSAGNRITTAATLVREGYAPIVLVSGPAGMYGKDEAYLAIEYAVSRGFPQEYFKPVVHTANSTLEEAWVFRGQLEGTGIKSVLVVTSDYHTARAGRTFRSVLQPIDVLMVAAPDREFRADSWWKNRPARKLVFMEWTKTIAHMLGI